MKGVYEMFLIIRQAAKKHEEDISLQHFSRVQLYCPFGTNTRILLTICASGLYVKYLLGLHIYKVISTRKELMIDLEGKIAVITGAGGDIGCTTAVTLAKQGASTVAVDIDENAVNETVKVVQDTGGKAEFAIADVTRPEDVEAYVKKAVSTFGGIDLFFNNAGIEGEGGSIVETTVEDFDKVLAVNVKGMFLGLKYTLPRMNKGGAVVNTASVAGLGGSPGMVAYVASKHAVIGITCTAALEAAAMGIRVNAVCPAPIKGRMMDSIEKNLDTSEDTFEQSIPMGRYGKVQEVANLVTMLLSDEASYLTGSFYTVDGGLTAS